MKSIPVGVWVVGVRRVERTIGAEDVDLAGQVRQLLDADRRKAAVVGCMDHKLRQQGPWQCAGAVDRDAKGLGLPVTARTLPPQQSHPHHLHPQVRPLVPGILSLPPLYRHSYEVSNALSHPRGHSHHVYPVRQRRVEVVVVGKSDLQC